MGVQSCLVLLVPDSISSQFIKILFRPPCYTNHCTAVLSILSTFSILLMFTVVLSKYWKMWIRENLYFCIFCALHEFICNIYFTCLCYQITLKLFIVISVYIKTCFNWSCQTGLKKLKRSLKETSIFCLVVLQTPYSKNKTKYLQKPH